MKFKGNSDTLYMKYPASWHMDSGRDGIPLGNGKTGVLVQGGVGDEEIIFNRVDLWHWASCNELPQLDPILQQMRMLIDKGDYTSANSLMYDKLVAAGYQSSAGFPMILGALKIHFQAKGMFSGYRRILRMDQGECEVSYRQQDKSVQRKCFVSREDDTFYLEYNASENSDISVSFDVYDDNTSNYRRVCEEIKEGLRCTCLDNGIVFRVKTDSMEYGAMVRVYGTGVTARTDNGHIVLAFRGTHFRIAVRCFSGDDSNCEVKAPEDFIYGEKLWKHSLLHKKLYQSADICLYGGEAHSNEELLDAAYEDVASLELIEKMWRFGRYLFISGTCEEGLPFPLYGLWHTKYQAIWPYHVANENVEMIYWHTDVGGLAPLVRPLIRYYSSAIETFRENARKLYGCRGIFVGGYSSPANMCLSTFVPVILHFTGVAGWLCRHFYKYYQMTGDRELLQDSIFPFMLEAADFYLDYIQYDEAGKIVYYPCVSPENTPLNLIDEKKYSDMQHPSPVTKNAVMEIAIVKDLFTNLITLIRETGEHIEYLPKLQKTLDDMPEYLINGEGALKEWSTHELEDNYAHRHISHTYPLFPGEEISEDHAPELYLAMARAVELRELGAQTGWSLAHMAAIYATLGQGDKTIECLDILLKGCTMNNFTTLHNDYRNMGITLNMREAPMQLDANMGFVNAVQKMLLDERCGYLSLLPALPTRISKGRVSKLYFTKGVVSMEWDMLKTHFEAKIHFTRAGEIRLKVPKEFHVFTIVSDKGTYELLETGTVLKADIGTDYMITCE